MKKDKRPDSIPPEAWPKFKELRDKFKEELKDCDVNQLNKVLDAHPGNIRDADENNPETTYIEWKDCPLHMTACYYANDRLEISKMIIPEIEELKELLDK